jgi:acyl carrier protein
MTDICITVRADDIPDLLGTLVRLIAPVRVMRTEPGHRLIADLGYHSLAVAELGFTLEDLFRVETFSPETAMTVERVEDVTGLIRRHLAEGDARLPECSEVDAIFARYGASWSVGR